ncbi:hypothetical protein ES705_11384 [subsurface metagenome]
MRIYLKINQVEFVLESLEATIKTFSEYQHYPDKKFKQERITEAEKVRQIFRDARNKYKNQKKGGKDENSN